MFDDNVFIESPLAKPIGFVFKHNLHVPTVPKKAFDSLKYLEFESFNIYFDERRTPKSAGFNKVVTTVRHNFDRRFFAIVRGTQPAHAAIKGFAARKESGVSGFIRERFLM